MSLRQRRALTVDDPIAGTEAGHVARLAAGSSDALSRLREISVRSIHPNPNQPRKHFDEATLSARADSIGQRGVLQQIVVRPTSRAAFELVAGERRWRAALIAGDLMIPALIDDKVDEAGSLELALIENVVREDLTPIEEATTIVLLLQDPNITETLLSKRLGRSRTDIAHTVRLLDLPDQAIGRARLERHIGPEPPPGTGAKLEHPGSPPPAPERRQAHRARALQHRRRRAGPVRATDRRSRAHHRPSRRHRQRDRARVPGRAWAYQEGRARRADRRLPRPVRPSAHHPDEPEPIRALPPSAVISDRSLALRVHSPASRPTESATRPGSNRSTRRSASRPRSSPRTPALTARVPVPSAPRAAARPGDRRDDRSADLARRRLPAPDGARYSLAAGVGFGGWSSVLIMVPSSSLLRIILPCRFIGVLSAMGRWSPA